MNRLEFSELLDYCKIKAIEHTLTSTEISVWRSLCRSYSVAFHTPLHLVFEMSPEDVMIAVFENQLNDFDEANTEQLLETIYSIEDPNYESDMRARLAEIDKEIEAKEAERIRLGKPIHKAMKNAAAVPTLKPQPKAPVPENKLPTSGYLNLGYLESLDNESGEFED